MDYFVCGGIFVRAQSDSRLPREAFLAANREERESKQQRAGAPGVRKVRS